jgi:N utilization substance protein B
MGKRRESRECALQMLFQLDLNPTDELDRMFADYWARSKAKPEAREFAERLVRGVVERHEEVDDCLKRLAENWDVARMSVVDRNIMRMGLFEMLHCPEIPPVVSINEAVDIAKSYSTAESGRFVNGILDRARADIGRPAREAAPES